MKKHVLVLMSLMFGLVLMAGSAGAVPLTLTVSTSGAGPVSSSSLTGSVGIFNTILGSWDIIAAAGTSDPMAPNTPFEANMDLSSLIVRSLNSSGSLTIDLVGTGYSLETSMGDWLEHAALSATLQGGSLTWEKIIRDEDGDIVFDQTFGPYTAAHGLASFSGDFLYDLSPTSGFSMESLITLTGLGKGQIISFDADDIINAPEVPEPATLLLFGSGFLGLVALRNRTKKG